MKNDVLQPPKRNSYAFIKGRIAETLIEELFLSLGFQVYPFGMENTVPEIKNQLSGNTEMVATQIRNMPDFVIKRPGENPLFVEVKFRANGSFKYKDLIKNYQEYPYKNVVVVVVSKSHIKAVFVEDLKEGKEIGPKTQNYLGKVLAFNKDEKEKIIDFCQYATQFFAAV